MFSTDTKEVSQSLSSVAGFIVECGPPDHQALMLTTTEISSNNCIDPFHTYLFEDEFPSFLTRILIRYFAPMELVTLSLTHMIPGIEASPDDVLQVKILL